MSDIEIHETCEWWAAFRADDYTPDPLAFGRTEGECRAALIASILRDDPNQDRGGAELDADTDVVYARVAMRLALRNNVHHLADEPQRSWLVGGGK